MLIAAIETSTAGCAVAIGTEGGVIAADASDDGKHAEFLIPALARLCDASGIARGDIEGVAVDIGPGLFTGLRVGVAAAKALAQARSVPILGVPSLDVLARSAGTDSSTVCACIDAKRGEVFAAFYRRENGDVRRLTEFTPYSPEALRAEIEARRDPTTLVGEGALRYRDLLASDNAEFARSSSARPDAGVLLQIAAPRLARGETDRLEALAPLYIRRSDAEINWDRKGFAQSRAERVKIPGER
jgi:tRNA threonylcarbamoyladenosine biosynthesis protein TsaB